MHKEPLVHSMRSRLHGNHEDLVVADILSAVAQTPDQIRGNIPLSQVSLVTGHPVDTPLKSRHLGNLLVVSIKSASRVMMNKL